MDPSSHSSIETGEGSATKQFRRFDVVRDHSDHFFLDANREAFANPSRDVQKKIAREWKVLEENLPDSIYVRVYERRIDLLRAVIVGPAGTPYHDALFFFDLAFPPDYPSQPPQISYLSFGLRLNPNLYANGRVCLSLLNTWVGNKSEKWNPSESTVLQVLVSIQGLVLNEKPYFNEPGTGFFPGGSKKSTAYSETAFLLSCKTMVYLIRCPPINFQDFIASHFRQRAHAILTACNAYICGLAKVGHYTDNGPASASPAKIHVSSNFKAMMTLWYPEMVASFDRIGCSVGNFVEQLRLQKEKERETASSKELSVKEKGTACLAPLVLKGSSRGLRKVIGKINKTLGWNKDKEKRIEVGSS